MKRIILCIAVAVAALLTSCGESVMSLHPFFSDETLQRDDRITGDWLVMGDTSTVIRIAPFDYHRDSTTTVHAYSISEMKVTRLRYEESKRPKNLFAYSKGKYYLYKKGAASNSKSTEEREPPVLAHLFKLENGEKYLDLTRFETEDVNDYSVGIHNLCKLTFRANVVYLHFFSQQSIKKGVSKKQVKIPQEDVWTVSSGGEYHNQKLITANPEKLQKFIMKYDKELFLRDSSLIIPLQRIVKK